jgi:hypothetical protein
MDMSIKELENFSGDLEPVLTLEQNHEKAVSKLKKDLSSIHNYTDRTLSDKSADQLKHASSMNIKPGSDVNKLLGDGGWKISSEKGGTRTFTHPDHSKTRAVHDNFEAGKLNIVTEKPYKPFKV